MAAHVGAVQQWDLNTGQVVREFTRHGAQISAIQLRPTARPMPSAADESGIKIVFRPKAEETEDVEMAVADGNAVDDVAGGPSTSGKDEDVKSEASFGSLFGDEENEVKPGDAADSQRRTSNAQTNNNTSGVKPPEAQARAGEPAVAAKDEEEAAAETDVKVKDSKAHKRRLSTAVKTAKREAEAALYSDDDEATNKVPAPRFAASNAPLPNILKDKLPTLSPATYKDYSDDVMLVASMDGQVALHDCRVASSLVGALETTDRTPPWCMSVSAGTIIAPKPSS